MFEDANKRGSHFTMKIEVLMHAPVVGSIRFRFRLLLGDKHCLSLGCSVYIQLRHGHRSNTLHAAPCSGTNTQAPKRTRPLIRPTAPFSSANTGPRHTLPTSAPCNGTGTQAPKRTWQRDLAGVHCHTWQQHCAAAPASKLQVAHSHSHLNLARTPCSGSSRSKAHTPCTFGNGILQRSQHPSSKVRTAMNLGTAPCSRPSTQPTLSCTSGNRRHHAGCKAHTGHTVTHTHLAAAPRNGPTATPIHRHLFLSKSPNSSCGKVACHMFCLPGLL